MGKTDTVRCAETYGTEGWPVPPELAESRIRNAYQVYEKVRHHAAVCDDHFGQLCEIAPAPEESWEPLAAALASGGWSVKDTSRKVADVARFDIPDTHTAWLPRGQVGSCAARIRHAGAEFGRCQETEIANAGSEFEDWTALRMAPRGAVA